jgi:hypothetical protein
MIQQIGKVPKRAVRIEKVKHRLLGLCSQSIIQSPTDRKARLFLEDLDLCIVSDIVGDLRLHLA